MAEAGQRKLSTKIVVCCVVFTTILSIVIGWLGYKTYSESVLERYHVYVDSIIKVAASSIDGDDMRTCIDTLQKSDIYEQTQTDLNTVKEETEMEFIYMVYFPDPDDPYNMAYVLNAYTEKELREEPETINTLGDPCGEGDFDEVTTELFYNCLWDDNNKTQLVFTLMTANTGT